MQSRVVYSLVYVAAFMSLGHHIDHMIRGNHVGWPLTNEVTPFTYSFAVYPLIILGLYLYRTDRVGSGYWALLSGAGSIFLAVVHFGPNAIEPPSDIINLYEPRIIGWFAFIWVVVLVVILAVSSLYETRLWWRQRDQRHALTRARSEKALRR